MVVYYSREQLYAIWNSEAFKKEYEEYKLANKSKIDKLLNINKKDYSRIVEPAKAAGLLEYNTKTQEALLK